MSDVAIRAEGLSKRYRIGGPRAPYKTIRETMINAAATPLRRVQAVLRGESALDSKDTIWALKDVSFEVKHGEVLGIIGRNGAGKTTLLKVLSRITKPTEGHAEVRGRVGSLLEVGTGFHPELTGRENVYLNGAILGMRKAEIAQRFDEIVAFAELEKFVDTPVKFYSSGMYVRLAFAVAAHLDPEILLVDEVLSVGDAAFQKKCLDKMDDVSRAGRTVVFVSHNMVAISALCSRGLLVQDGVVRLDAEAQRVVAHYRDASAGDSSAEYVATGRPGGSVWIERVGLGTVDGKPSTSFSMSEPIQLTASFRFTERRERLRVAIRIREMTGSPIYQIMNLDSRFEISHGEGVVGVRATMQGLNLYPNTYLLSLVLGDASNEVLDSLHEDLRFTITQDSRLCQRRLPRSSGVVFATAHWERVEPG